jgi:uncharacterized membrane protein
MRKPDLLRRSAAEALGATVAALLLWAIWPSQPADLGATVPSIAAGRAVILEAVMSGLGRRAWYLLGWARRVLPDVRFGHS